MIQQPATIEDYNSSQECDCVEPTVREIAPDVCQECEGVVK